MILPSGKELYCNNGIISIDDEGDMSEGYDNYIDTRELTIADKHYIADMMITRWKEYKQNIEEK